MSEIYFKIERGWRDGGTCHQASLSLGSAGCKERNRSCRFSSGLYSRAVAHVHTHTCTQQGHNCNFKIFLKDDREKILIFFFSVGKIEEMDPVRVEVA